MPHIVGLIRGISGAQVKEGEAGVAVLKTPFATYQTKYDTIFGYLCSCGAERC